MRLVVRADASGVRVGGLGPDGAPRVVQLPAPAAVPAVQVGGVASVAAGRPEVVVVDVGHTRSEVTLLQAGTVVARRSAPGGSALDRAVAALLGARCPAWSGRPELPVEARRVRETLSLQPDAVARLPGSPHAVRVDALAVRAVLREPLGAVVDAVRELTGSRIPVLLIGGGARTPLLAELLDADHPDVTVAARPEAAAVIGTLATPPRPRPADRPRWLPPPRPRGHPGRAGGVAAVGAVVLLVTLHLLGATLTPVVDGLPPRDVLAQYGYRLQVPAGWAHTGGRPERRRSLLTPVGAPAGSDLIVVESTPLGYDSGAEPGRAARELRAVFDEAVAAGSPLAGYVAAERVGARTVVAYTERVGETDVQWYVVLDGGTQLSVGCRHTRAGAAAVRDACARVVGTVEG